MNKQIEIKCNLCLGDNIVELDSILICNSCGTQQQNPNEVVDLSNKYECCEEQFIDQFDGQIICYNCGVLHAQLMKTNDQDTQFNERRIMRGNPKNQRKNYLLRQLWKELEDLDSQTRQKIYKYLNQSYEYHIRRYKQGEGSRYSINVITQLYFIYYKLGLLDRCKMLIQNNTNNTVIKTLDKLVDTYNELNYIFQ